MITAFAKYYKHNWDGNLVDFEVAYNSSVHKTTMHTPFFLNYGIHPRTIPLHMLSSNNPSVTHYLENIRNPLDMPNKIRKSNEAAARYAQKIRIPHKWLSTQNLSLEDGSGNRKLHPKFCGSFKITEKFNEVTFV